MDLTPKENEIIEELKKAIKKTYEETNGYFNPTTGRERSMVFRIAHHLATKIENENQNDDSWYVDIEPTRCNGDIKKIIEEYKEHKGIPDMIVHQRRGIGLLVVEFKCDINADKQKHDYEKLISWTNKERDTTRTEKYPTYELGAFVYLGNQINDVRVTLFNNGDVYKKKENLSLNLVTI